MLVMPALCSSKKEGWEEEVILSAAVISSTAPGQCKCQLSVRYDSVAAEVDCLITSCESERQGKEKRERACITFYISTTHPALISWFIYLSIHPNICILTDIWVAVALPSCCELLPAVQSTISASPSLYLTGRSSPGNDHYWHSYHYHHHHSHNGHCSFACSSAGTSAVGRCPTELLLITCHWLFLSFSFLLPFRTHSWRPNGDRCQPKPLPPGQPAPSMTTVTTTRRPPVTTN